MWLEPNKCYSILEVRNKLERTESDNTKEENEILGREKSSLL